MTPRWLPILFLLATTLSCGGAGQAPLAVSPPKPLNPAADAGSTLPLEAGPSVETDAAQAEAAPAAEATPAESAAALDGGAPDDSGDVALVAAEDEPWCPPGVEMLPGPICAVVPAKVQADPAPTLVIFLHGVTNVGSGWQLALIQGMARYAEHQDFALLAPRAPRQPPRGNDPEVYAWRTTNLAPGGEDALLDTWMTAKAELEARTGHPFAQVFVMGFSSGAYYASSLALRGRLPVDGYAAFAGGSAPYSRGMISHVKQRAPIFVGYGLKDKAGSRDARGLVAALRAARWKHREMAVRRAGHSITTSQFTSALAYLRSMSAPGASAPPNPVDTATAAPSTRPGRERAPASRPPRKPSKRRAPVR